MSSVQYLGLVENVRVRRAGFAYRRPFEKFLQRYSILTPQTFQDWSPFNRGGRRGQPQQAIQCIMQTVNMDRAEWQLGHTKVFIKSPESLFLLEEIRERKYNVFARAIQKAWRKYAARRKTNTQATEAARLLAGRKQRCRASISRQFVGDYLGLDHDDRAELMKHLGRRERVLFALQITKFNRKFAASNRELIVTETNIRLFGYRPAVDEKQAKKMHPNQIPYESFVDFQITYDQLVKIELSRLQDGFILIRYRPSNNQPVDPKAPLPRPILIECSLKTELLWALDKNLAKKYKRNLPLEFVDQFSYDVEASGFLQKKGLKKTAPRTVVFQEGATGPNKQSVDTKSKKYFMIVNVAQGAPARVMPDERPQGRPPHHGQHRPQQQQRPQQFRQPQPAYGNQQAQQRPAQFVPRFNQPSQPPMSHHQQVFAQFRKL